MKPIEEKKKTKTKQEPDKKKENPMFNFDSLYFNDSKPKVKKSPPKAEMDDDLFSDPFGVSGGKKQKPKKSRSINVDVRMGNAKLKHKVREDRNRKKQNRQNKVFQRPNSELMFDAFDDLEEEMIDEGVIGNGNKNELPKRTDSIAPAKQLKWNTQQESSRGGYDSYESNASSGRKKTRGRGGNRGGNGGGNSDGWF